MSFFRDLQFALRQLRMRPAFFFITVLTLALGMGGTTAIFSVVNNVLLRPLAVSDPEKITVIHNVWKGQVGGRLSAGDFTDLQQQFKSAETLAAAQSVSLTLEDQDSPERIIGQRATGGYFRLFAVAPIMGRTFAEDEDEAGKDSVVVLSEQMWRANFQADARILGRNIHLNGRPYQVIGVMPSRFELAEQQQRLWIPMAFTAERRKNYDEQPYTVCARLKAGVTLAQAQSELQVIAKDHARRFPQEAGQRSYAAEPLVHAMLAETRPTMYMLLGASVFVLLIACVNVGTLQLARARTRRREMAIRNALGASPLRLVRQLLTESFAIAVLGGAFGLLIAFAILRLVVSRAPETIPRLGYASVDGWALCFTFLTVLAAALLSGGWAAARVRYFQTNEDLRSGRATGSASTRDRLRGAMVITEVALALVLLVCAGLLIRSGISASRVPLGFEASNLIAARVNLPAAKYTQAESLRAVFRRLEEDAQALPGVKSAALIDRAPLSGGGSNGLVPEGKPFTAEYVVQSALHIVTPRYLETVGTQLLSGRHFDASDRKSAPAVMMVNQAFARAGFGADNAVGKRVSWTKGEYITIVGVVENIHHYGVTRDAPPEFYIPLEQAPDVAIGWMAGTAELMLRTSGDTNGVANELRSLMKQIDAAAPVYRVQSMDERVAATLQERRFTMLLLTSFAGLALFLATIGIYGVLSYVVSERTQEIGIRMALGAQPGQVLRMVIGDGFRLVLFGSVLGCVAALGAGRLIRSLLFNVPPDDLTTFVLGGCLLIALALIASYIPAARALRIDPVIALRSD